MSSDYSIAEDVSVPQARAPSRLDRGLKGLVIVISIILGAELIWLFVVTPMMPLASVEITGIADIDQVMVLSAAGIGPRSSYLTVNTRSAEAALEELYQIESASVVKRYPDGVRIILEPRRALAMSLAAMGNRVYPVFFDKHGVLIRIGQDSREAVSPSLPIISGLVIGEPRLGLRLPAALNSFLVHLDAISRSAPELLSAISEIRINKKEYDGFDLVLYPVHYPVRVRVGTELNEDMLRYMMLMIDVLVLQGVDVEELDFRTGTASYTLKGASSGGK
jgi:cell division protein FtsQ